MYASSEYQSRFGGIGRLYGFEKLELFSGSHVAVVGIGGVGTWVAEALARSGIGALTLMDLDDICVSNTNRQLHALSSSVGQPKTAVMAARLKDINPLIKIIELSAFYSESTSGVLFDRSFDVLVDAIDSVRQKAHLLATARSMDKQVVTVGGAAGRIDPSCIKEKDLSRSEGDRLLMLVRKKLRSEYGFPRPGKGRFRIPCVYSDEVPRFPASDGSVCDRAQSDQSSGMNCDTGLGSATHLTATMGFFVAACVLKLLIDQQA
jgi:tRNA A37 threonylcarbamoyladenosine dehydratase